MDTFSNLRNKRKTKWSKKSIKIHPNGFTARYHNKRIDFVEKDGGGYIIKFSVIKKNPQAQFTCQSEILKDKLDLESLKSWNNFLS